MSWQPIGREALEARIEAERRLSREEQRTWFDARRVPLEKWSLAGWGDGGGGFWAVAVDPGWLLWFNDIEDGFEVSRFVEPGVIPAQAYGASQFELAMAVRALRERVEDENVIQAGSQRAVARVRAVELGDAAAIVELLGPIVAAGGLTSIAGPGTVAAQREFIRELPERAVYLAAMGTGGEGLLGIQDVLPVTGQPGRGEVSTFVRLEHGRSGVGRALFAEMSGLVTALGFRELDAVVLEGNGGALGFYGALGFREVGSEAGPVRRLRAELRGVAG